MARLKDFSVQCFQLKQYLNLRDGEMAPLTRVRSPAAGITYLNNFMNGFKNIEAVGIEHTTSMENAVELARRFSSTHPKVPVLHSTVSPVLGVYSCPNALAVTILEAE